jgi:hypothetical protein
VVAVKRAADKKLLRTQRIINPSIPREVIVASHSQRMPSLAGQLFTKALQEHVRAMLES